MHARRRGLTVLELLIIIIVLAVAVVVLTRVVRNRSTGSGAGLPPDSAILAPPGSGNELTARLAFLAPLDSSARAGDTLEVRVRATTEGGTAVTQATVRFEVTDGGGHILPDSAITNDLGDADARWVLGTEAGEQVLRAGVNEPGVPPITVSIHARAAGAPTGTP